MYLYQTQFKKFYLMSNYKSLSSVQLLSHVRFFLTPWTAATQASLSITNSQCLLKLMSIELVMPSKHLTLCCPLLLLPSIFPSIRVFSSESVLRIRWLKYYSFSFSISPSNVYSGLISFRISLLSKGLSRVLSNTTVQKHQFFGIQYDGGLKFHAYRFNNCKEKQNQKIFLKKKNNKTNVAYT